MARKIFISNRKGASRIFIAVPTVVATVLKGLLRR